MRVFFRAACLIVLATASPRPAFAADVSCPSMLTTAGARLVNPAEIAGWRPVFEADNAQPVLALDVTLLAGAGQAREEIVASERTGERLVWPVERWIAP